MLKYDVTISCRFFTCLGEMKIRIEVIIISNDNKCALSQKIKKLCSLKTMCRSFFVGKLYFAFLRLGLLLFIQF